MVRIKLPSFRTLLILCKHAASCKSSPSTPVYSRFICKKMTIEINTKAVPLNLMVIQYVSIFDCVFQTILIKFYLAFLLFILFHPGKEFNLSGAKVKCVLLTSEEPSSW